VTQLHACCHELPIPAASKPAVWPELPQDVSHSLPRPTRTTHEWSVPAPRVTLKGVQILHDSQANRIKVDIPDKLQKVWFLLHQDGLVTILKEVADAPVTPIESASVSREKRSHSCTEGSVARTDQEVRVIGEKCPGQHAEPGHPADSCQPIEEAFSVLVVAENRLPIESSDHHVMEGARQIKARTTRHV
jgi:hypothetical protein